MGKTILTPFQKNAIEVITQCGDISRLFYLTGGTALAEFYLKHRFSDDLDFFTHIAEFPTQAVESAVEKIRKALGTTEVRYRRAYDRRMFFFPFASEELKIEFTYYPFAPIHQPSDIGGLRVDSLEDIAVNKLMALFDRVEPKDFADIFFILKKTTITIPKLHELLATKFHLWLEAVTLGSEFAKVRSLEALPKMIKPLTIAELKQFFSDRARELAPEIFT